MKKEIEIRFRISKEEKENILSVLQDASWNPTMEEDVDVYFYNKKLVDTGKTQESPYVIRIRKSKKGNKLTYKLSTRQGSWIEIESGIEDPDSMRRILEYLGYSAYIEIQKKRQSGRVGNIEINIDEIKNLGLFIEFEILAEDEAKGEREIIEFATEKLGMPKANIIYKGYVQLMREFSKKKNQIL